MLSFEPSYYAQNFQDNVTGSVTTVPLAGVFLCIPPLQAAHPCRLALSQAIFMHLLLFRENVLAY